MEVFKTPQQKLGNFVFHNGNKYNVAYPQSQLQQ